MSFAFLIKAIAVSEMVKSSLIQDLGVGEKIAAKIAVVANGVEIPELLSSTEKEAVRAGLNIPEDIPLVLAAGRFSDQKNFADLISAAAILQDRRVLFHLVLGGDGEHRPLLETMIRELDLGEKISMPGNLVNLNQVMLASDVVTMSSLWEGLPLVLLEAMAAGLPGVAYGIPGVVELIESGETGIIAQVGSPDSLADGLELLCQDSTKRIDMGCSSRQLVEHKYNFTKVVGRLMKQYLLVRN